MDELNIKDLSKFPLKLVDTIDKKIINVYENKEDILKYGFACASYIWGSNWEYECMGINCYRNLNLLIRKVKEIGIKYIWIDQLCINQNNIKEKEIEISKMPKFYELCDVVVIFIGDKDQRIEDKDMAINQYSIDKWFTRMWTLQETIVPPRMVVITDWGILYSDVENNLPSGEDIGFHIGPKEIRNIRVKSDKNISEILNLSQKRNCTLKQDKIYAMLSILPYKINIPIDYNENYEEIENQFYKELCKHNDISFLCNINISKNKSWKPIIDNCIFPNNVKRIPFKNTSNPTIIDNKLQTYIKSFKIVKSLNVFYNKDSNIRYDILKTFGFSNKNILKIMKNLKYKINLKELEEENLLINIIKEKINTELYLSKVLNELNMFIEWIIVNENEIWPILTIGEDIECNIIGLPGLQSKGLEIGISCNQENNFIRVCNIVFLNQSLGIKAMNLPIQNVIIL